MFKALPKHGSVLDLFPPATTYPTQQPVSAFGSHFASALPDNHHADEMDHSFGTQDTSIDGIYEESSNNDFSFASTVSLESPISPPAFRDMQSSPYGMDICSPSPGHPMYGKRINPQVNVEDSGSKVFGSQHDYDSSIPSINNPPGTLLKRLTADVGDDNFGPISTGSFRSNRSTGKVGSIKTISTIKERDLLSKARARARGTLPSTWLDQRPQSMIQLSESQTVDGLSSQKQDNSDEPGDVSMEDAMDVDSPLAARRPPKAHIKPRPLSLLIPSTISSPASTQASSISSAVPPSSLPSAISQGVDEFGQFFVDTPEPTEKTAIPRYNKDGMEESPYPFGRPRDSSPLASPSADKFVRCLSAGIPPSSSSSSLASGFPSSTSGSSTGAPSNGLRTAGPIASTRIPSLRNKVLQRPGLSTLGQPQPQETQSAGVVSSARMAPMAQRRAVSAFIQPEQFSIQGPASRTAIPRPTSGLAKGRVVSCLIPSTKGDDVDDSGNEFSSPSLPSRGAAHRRLRSNGGGSLGLMGRGGNLAMRTASQQQVKSAFATQSAVGPSPVRPLLPFGDGEHHGKILPCHSVKEDGLMRITPSTLRALLSGAYDAQIKSYQIIDCRFSFEYEGGHIAGAINLNKDEDIERFLFDEAIRRRELPPPSQSGTPGVKPPVLVFHCEFSAKRGPTFAKHFRAKDRARNAHEYPKLHYPELYILEGGYCAYYSAYPETCQPRGYVKMDCAEHRGARAADLNQFRKWNRTRSYTYGDSQALPSQPASAISSSQSASIGQYKPSSGSLLAAQYATNDERMQGHSGLQTLREGHSPLEELEQHDVEATPDLDHDREFDSPDLDVLSEVEDGDDAEHYGASEALQDASFDDEEGSINLEEFGASEATEHPANELAQEEEDEEDDHLESSPCVTAEMKRNKNRGRTLLERTFKPLNFSKPFSLSSQQPVAPKARGMSRAISHAV